jgi:lactoylglutathione lyase
MITGLTHAAILVADLDRSLRFYVEVLGLPEQFRLMNDDGGVCLVYLKVGDGQFVELFPGAKAAHAEPGGAAFVHICLQVDDIQAAYRELTARGLVAKGEPILGGDNAWQFWTEDPDGNPIEFHQFTSESKQITG